MVHTIWSIQNVYLNEVDYLSKPILGLFLLYFVMSRKFRNKLSVLMMILLLTKGGLKYFQREISSRSKKSPSRSFRGVKDFSQ